VDLGRGLAVRRVLAGFAQQDLVREAGQAVRQRRAGGAADDGDGVGGGRGRSSPDVIGGEEGLEERRGRVGMVMLWRRADQQLLSTHLTRRCAD